jgi:hypothetical protein
VSKVGKNINKNITSAKKGPKKSAPVGSSGVAASSPGVGPSSAPAPSIPSQPAGGFPDLEQKRIQEMLVHAQLEFNKIKSSIVKEKKREVEALDELIKEFVGPFMLIGYDLTNNPIEMVSASSPAEHDALLERLRRVMYKINQNIANSGGNDPYGHSNNS